MSLDERIDAKLGYSSWCRRDEHRTCASARARCTCACHGTRGQQPPTTTKETSVNQVAEAIPLRPPPDENARTPVPGYQPCADCGRTFSAHGLQVHRARMHKNGAPAPKPAKPAAPRAAVAPENIPWVVVVGELTPGTKAATAIVFASESDARLVADAVETIGNTAHVLRLAESR